MITLSPKLVKTAPVFLVILVSIIWLMALEAIDPFFFLRGDSADLNLPWYTYNWRAVIENKTFPLINFHQYLGQTHFAQAQTSVLYPPVYIAVGLSKLLFNNVYYSVDILVISHLVAGTLCLYLFLRKIKIPSTISVLVSLLWITNPYLISTTKAWVFPSFLALFLPLNFLALVHFLRKPNFFSALFLTIIKVFLLFSGYLPAFFMTLIFEGLFVGIIFYKHIDSGNINKIRSKLILYIGSLIVFLLLTGMFFGPVLEAQQLSQNRDQPRPFKEFMRYALTFKDLADAQLYQFHPKKIFKSNSHAYYLGIFLLVIPMLLLVRKIREQTQEHRTTLFFSLAIIAYMLSTSVHKYLYNVPGFNFFRGPHKYFLFFSFFLIISVAGILTTLTREKSRFGKVAIYSLLLFSLTLNATVIIQNKKDSMDKIRIEIPPNLKALNFINKDLGRVFALNYRTNGNDSYRLLTNNFATLFNVNHFAGNDTLISKLNYKLALKLHHASIYSKLPDQKLLDYLSKWSVRYLITGNSTRRKNHLKQFDQLQLIYQDKTILLYENVLAFPYVYENNNSTVSVPFSFGINRLDIFPTNQNPHQLTISLAPLPKYYIFIDDKARGPINPEQGPITIEVPAGTKKVSIKYIDNTFILGSIVAILTLLGISLYTIYRLYKRSLCNKRSPRLPQPI